MALPASKDREGVNTIVTETYNFPDTRSAEATSNADSVGMLQNLVSSQRSFAAKEVMKTGVFRSELVPSPRLLNKLSPQHDTAPPLDKAQE